MLGDEIRKARKKADLTQEELAFKAGIARNYVSLLELDQKSPTVETLTRLCDALDVRPSKLLAAVERQRARR
jgi:transcriptional regulator with XRE-family HTH domain